MNFNLASDTKKLTSFEVILIYSYHGSSKLPRTRTLVQYTPYILIQSFYSVIQLRKVLLLHSCRLCFKSLYGKVSPSAVEIYSSRMKLLNKPNKIHHTTQKQIFTPKYSVIIHLA